MKEKLLHIRIVLKETNYYHLSFNSLTLVTAEKYLGSLYRRILAHKSQKLLNNPNSSCDVYPKDNESSINESPFDETFCLMPSELRECVNAKIGIIIHVYYIDLFEEICSYLENIPFRYSAFISISNSNDKKLIIKNLRKLKLLDFAEVKVVKNVGRDIAPLLVDFAHQIRHFDYICHIHTKKSISYGTEQIAWRQHLYKMLLGSNERVRAIISLFEANEYVGIIYPKPYEYFPYWAYTWLSNKNIASPILKKLGIHFDPDEYIDYPAGSMFWAKRAALKPLLDLNLKHEDFPEELGQTDGTIHHTIERCFVLVAQKEQLNFAILMHETDNIFSFKCNKNFPQYLQSSFEEKLFTKSKFADVISFDLFDTLLIRPFAKPDSVFDYIEEKVNYKYGIKNFKFMRIEAEKASRAKKNHVGDVNISEIYFAFAEIAKIDFSLSRKLLEMEVNIELALLKPREYVVKLARNLKASGKRLIIVSDTYLDKQYIKTILSNNEIDFFDNVYISCDIGKRKDRQDIWEYVLSHEDVEKKRFLHIGDNEHSDNQILLNHGFMEPVHLIKPSELFRHSSFGETIWKTLEPYRGWKENLLFGIIANLYCSDPTPKKFFLLEFPLGDPHSLGYIIYGPIVFSFLSWLIKTSSNDGIEHLKFISRDGYLLSIAYELILKHPSLTYSDLKFPDATYFLSSRRAARFSLFKDENDIPILLEEYFDGTLRNFFENRLHIYDMDIIESQIGLNELEQKISLPKDSNKVGILLTKFIEILTHQADDERSALIKYCKQEGLDGDGKIGLVDIGYSGSVQTCLIKLLDIELHGYYFITNKKSAAITSLNDSTVQGYFGNFVDIDESKIPIARYYLLMELILTAPHGQLIYFKRCSSTIKPIPIYDQTEMSEEWNKISLMQKGVFLFIENLLNQFGQEALEIDFPKELIQKCFEMVATGILSVGDLQKFLLVESNFTGQGNIDVLDWCKYRK